MPDTANIQINFEWKIDESGYRVEARGNEDWIVRNGGRMQRTEPLLKERLFVAFSRIETKHDLLEFCKIHGSLTRGGLISDAEFDGSSKVITRAGQRFDVARLHPGDAVSPLLQEAGAFRRVLGVIDDPDRLARVVESARTKPLRIASSRMVADPIRGVSISLEPDSLLEALRLSLTLSLAGAEVLKECPNCSRPFMAGGSTGKRQDAVFCSTGCQKQHHRISRK